MSRFIFACFVLLLIIAFCGFTLYDMYKTKTGFLKELDEMKAAAEKGDFEKAWELSVNFSEGWEKAQKRLTRYIRHHYLDNITEESAKLPYYAKYEAISDFTAGVETIITQITHLWESELPLLHNFF